MCPAVVAPPKGTRCTRNFSDFSLSTGYTEKRSLHPFIPITFQIASNPSSNGQAKRWLSLWSPLESPMSRLTLPPSFLLTAALLTNLVVNSQSLTTTWHAYNQDQVEALSDTKACERYWNSSTSQSDRILGNNASSLAGFSKLRLWPGNVALLQS